MGNYGVFLHDAAGRGIPQHAIYHTHDICAGINGACLDTKAAETEITSHDGIINFFINGQQPNHWFYWNRGNPNGSGANSSHRVLDPSTDFWADIQM